MAPASFVPLQPENTAFIKELQWKENRSQDEFLGNLLSDETLPKDHIALKHYSSSSSSGGGRTRPVDSTLKSADDPQIYTQLSINLWKRINAGYLIPRRPPAGVTRSIFTYDPSLIECQSKEFHRKRDFYSEYNEAAARFKLVHGNKKPLSKPKRVVKGSEDANAVKDVSSPSPFDSAQPSTTNPDTMNTINNSINQNPAPNTTSNTSLDANPSAQNPALNSTAFDSKTAELPS